MNHPEVLYKYEAISSQSLENLKAQVIYFGSPLNFNDPYDCAAVPNIKIPTDEDVERIREARRKDPRLSEAGRSQVASMSTEDLRQLFVRTGRSVFEETVNKFLKTRGVTCFSEINDDLLMWSHYGGKYKGICLEFSTKHEPFSRAKPVTYSDAIPQIDVSDLLADNKFEGGIDAMFRTKSGAWRYEREWRAMHAEAGTKFGYPAEALSGVYFGPDIGNEAMEIVCLILQGQNPTVKFWKGRRSSENYKVLFEQFQYTSYLEAKSKGLRP